MTVHEVLVAARNLIDREGWCQGTEGLLLTGPVCALGSIGRASGTRTSRYACGEGYSFSAVYKTGACQILASVLGVAVGPPVFLWNDRAGRTKEEVLAAFDKAIAATAPAPDFESLTEVEHEVAA